MGLEIYTGLSISSGDAIATEKLSKLEVTTENLNRALGFYGALITTSYQTGTSKRTFQKGSDLIIPFDNPVFDTSGFWDSSNPQSFFIPEGFSYAEFWVHGRYPSGEWALKIIKNGSGVVSAMSDLGVPSTANEHTFFYTKSARIAVTPGDYFQAYLYASGIGSLDFDAALAYYTYYTSPSNVHVTQSPLFQFHMRAYP